MRPVAAAFAALFLSAWAAPVAQALPGQCVSSPWGGFCDSSPSTDGSFSHCENAGWGGFSYSNCYQACIGGDGRPYQTDLDPATRC